MGAFTTLRVSRRAAGSYLLSRLACISDRELEVLLDKLISEDRLYNVQIVADEEAEDDDRL